MTHCRSNRLNRFLRLGIRVASPTTTLPPSVYDSHFPPTRRIAARCRLSRLIRLGIGVASPATTLPPSVHDSHLSPARRISARRRLARTSPFDAKRFKASKHKLAPAAAHMCLTKLNFARHYSPRESCERHIPLPKLGEESIDGRSEVVHI